MDFNAEQSPDLDSCRPSLRAPVPLPVPLQLRRRRRRRLFLTGMLILEQERRLEQVPPDSCENKIQNQNTMDIVLPSMLILTTTATNETGPLKEHFGKCWVEPLLYKRLTSSPSPPRPQPPGHSPGAVSPQGCMHSATAHPKESHRIPADASV